MLRSQQRDKIQLGEWILPVRGDMAVKVMLPYRILKLWQRGTSLPIYLSRVIRNFVIDFHRANRIRTRLEVAADGVDRHEKDPDAPRNKKTPGAPHQMDEITAAIELRELRKAGLQAWANLDTRDRFLMCGKFHRELDHDAMAERLKVTAGALRTALSRAQGRLLERLKTIAPEYFPI
jgi:RNA polymerase sigma factor (sigma-70 family)